MKNNETRVYVISNFLWGGATGVLISKLSYEETQSVSLPPHDDIGEKPLLSNKKLKLQGEVSYFSATLYGRLLVSSFNPNAPGCDISVNPLKNVVLQNQLRLSSCVGNLSLISNSPATLCSTKQSQVGFLHWGWVISVNNFLLSYNIQSKVSWTEFTQPILLISWFI